MSEALRRAGCLIACKGWMDREMEEEEEESWKWEEQESLCRILLLVLVMVVVLSWERWRHEALGMLQA